MSTAAEKRAAVATLLREALPEDWTVYPSPPETIASPAVVIAPRSPYRTDETFTEERVNLALRVVVKRAAGTDALDIIDATVDLLMRGSDPILAAASITNVENTVDIALAQDGGVDYIVGTINVTVS